MAEFVLPPEMEAFAEAAGDAAMGPFQAADFNADPSAAFSEGMGAAMERLMLPRPALSMKDEMP